MSRDVLDMIDNVVAQHGDAMRWSPDADPAPAEFLPGNLAAISESFDRIAAVLAAKVEEFARAFEPLAATLRDFLRDAAKRDQERTQRLRRMRSSYPRRWRKR